MCRGRLLDGLEPACVNACPENAIQIEIVNKIAWQENYALAESPGMPPAGQTISTTRITLPERSSAWLERVDTGIVPPEHAHPSLVVMTTTVQATFGALTILVLTRKLDTASITLLLLLTAVALNVSVFHLGRPAYAWRAMKMWRRSWLSREVLFFALFFSAIGVCALSSWAAALGVTACRDIVLPAAAAGVFFGLCGTLASAYIYLVRARPAWNMVHTPLDFLLSAGLIGTALTAWMPSPADTLLRLSVRFGLHLQRSGASSNGSIATLIATAWIANQVVRTLRLRGSNNFEMRASYNLLRAGTRVWKLAVSLLTAAASTIFLAVSLPLPALVTAIAAVMLSRYLFFVSVVPLGMGLTFLKGKSVAHGMAA
jgi:DMSO reductase anchor subunit